MKLFLSVLWLCCSTAVALAQSPRIGDPGWEFDEARFDPRYPAMREWAKAGVEGGIPPRRALPIKQRLKPGDDLQAAIDAVAARGGGVLLVEPGQHFITAAIRLKSGVVLRGADKERSVLAVKMKAPFFKSSGRPPVTAIEINEAERVGIEDLTIRYAAAAFEPYDKSDFNAAWERRVFHEPETRDEQLFVHLLIFTRSRNCWVDNCNLLWAGAHPLGMNQCRHMTLRDNFVDRAYVKKSIMQRLASFCFIFLLALAAQAQTPPADPFLRQLYDRLHDAPAQQRFRQLAPMPAGVVYIQQPGEGEREIREHFRVMKRLGFNALKQIAPLPTWTVERIQLIALEEGPIPWWYGEGGYEPITGELLKRLGIPASTPMAEALKHPAMLKHQYAALKRRIERTQEFINQSPDKQFMRTGSVAFDPEVGGRGVELTAQGERLFLEWLKKTYGTVEKLNDAWNQPARRRAV